MIWWISLYILPPHLRVCRDEVMHQLYALLQRTDALNSVALSLRYFLPHQLKLGLSHLSGEWFPRQRSRNSAKKIKQNVPLNNDELCFHTCNSNLVFTDDNAGDVVLQCRTATHNAWTEINMRMFIRFFALWFQIALLTSELIPEPTLSSRFSCRRFWRPPLLREPWYLQSNVFDGF